MRFVSRHPDFASGAAAATLAVAGVVIAQELWRVTPAIPLGYVSDGSSSWP